MTDTAQRTKPWYQSTWFVIAVSVGLLAVLMQRVNSAEAISFARRAHWGFILAALLFFPLDRVFMAWKWLLLARTHVPGLSLLTAVRCYYLGAAAGMLLPIGGLGPDAVRILLLRQEGVATEHALSSILVERLIGLVGSMLMIVVSLLFLAWQLDNLAAQPLLQWLAGISVTGSLLGIALIGSPALRSLIGADGWLLRLFTRLGFGKHWQATLDYARRPGLLLVSVGLAFVEQLAPVIAFFLCCNAFEVNISFLQCLAIIPVTAILERIPISFGGLGVREAGIVFMASLFRIPYSDALLTGIANEALFLLSLLPAVLFVSAIPKNRPTAPLQ